jgi:hypothetical protein
VFVAVVLQDVVGPRLLFGLVPWQFPLGGVEVVVEAGLDMSEGRGDQVRGPRVEVPLGVRLLCPLGEDVLQAEQPLSGDIGVEFGDDGPGREEQELVGCGGDRAGCAGGE